MKKFLLGGAALVALAAPAFAADMPARTYTKAPAYTAPQVVYNWTGFYIGGHIGGAFAGNNSLEGSGGRFLGGVQGGVDYQFAPNWVIGAEAQYSWLTNNNNGVLFPGNTLVTTNNNQLGSVTGRLGYTWGPALLYAKGGYAWRDNPNLGVRVRRRAGGLYDQWKSQGWLYRRRRPRIHVRAELVGQGRVPVLQFRQHHLHGRARPNRRRAFPGRRTYRQGRHQLPLRLGRSDRPALLTPFPVHTITERPALRRPFCFAAPFCIAGSGSRRALCVIEK